MGVGGAGGAAKAVQYTSGGRTHTYRGPADATGSTRCDTALSACSVCGLTPAERQMWHGKLMGPVVNLVKVNVGGGILAIPLTFRLCGALPATAMLIFFAAMSHYSSTLLARVGRTPPPPARWLPVEKVWDSVEAHDNDPLEDEPRQQAAGRPRQLAADRPGSRQWDDPGSRQRFALAAGS